MSSTSFNLKRISINGAGPTGSILALAMSQAGFQVNLYDKKQEKNIQILDRAYALTHSSRVLFERLKLWNELKKYTTPFQILKLEDRELSSFVTFSKNDLCNENRRYNAIGWIINHQDLMHVLFNKIYSESNITISFGLNTSNDFDYYDLRLAADGSFSSIRDNLNIGTMTSKKKRGCITAKVLIRGAEESCAYECFLKQGPLAILPIGSSLYQVILSSSFSKCKELTKLSHPLFLDKLAAILPSGLQPDALLNDPMTFSVDFLIARKLHKNNTILVGESAHRIHPVAGQGLNLCLRDISTLYDLAIEGIHSPRIFSRTPTIYQRKRILDVLLLSLLTENLLYFFNSTNPFKKILRFLIFKLMNSSIFIRRVILMAMTDGPLSIFNIYKSYK